MLFRQDYGFTPLAMELSDEVHHILQDVFRKYVGMGCSPRDVGYIITSQIPLVDMEFRKPYNSNLSIKVKEKSNGNY